MKKFIVTIVIVVLLASCTNKSATEKALLDAGFHPIEIGGYSFFGCSEDDIYKTKFKAYSPDSSRIVKGCVCKGIFKGNTIRLD
jgi:hypothetical protein